MRSILFPQDKCDPLRLGGKAAALQRLTGAGFPVPQWFAITPEAGEHDGAAGDTRLGPPAALPTEVLSELHEALREMSAAGSFAVRSSAVQEDGPEHSFAGQLDSFLFVEPEELPDRVQRVWCSASSERITAYRAEHDLGSDIRVPAVLVQEMVDADSSGVAFSIDPITGEDVAIVGAVFGLGTSLVSGEADADTYRVSSTGELLERHIARKDTADRVARGTVTGVKAVPVLPELQDQPVLDDAQVRAVARLARRAQEFFGVPQDIEWAVSEGHLYILQSRPLTAIAPRGQLNIWDNSNIAESYNGVTTPLTFSFARNAYAHVYRELCRIARVRSDVIAGHRDVFDHMLGLIGGRVYYNLLNWYRLLALVPGFTVNRRFMEQMMGVKEPLPEEITASLDAPGGFARLRDSLRLARMAKSFIVHFFLLRRHVASFYRRLEEVLGEQPDLDQMSMDEIVAYYRNVEARLMTRWDVPLVNDFFAMVFFGLLGKLTHTWCGAPPSLQNDLLCGEGGVVSSEPARRVVELADRAAPDAALVAALQEGSVSDVMSSAECIPGWRSDYEAYLARFGDRCLEELKLESPTVEDDPTTLLRCIGAMAAGGASRPSTGDTTRSMDAASHRGRAEVEAMQALRQRPLRRLIFRWVLANARSRVRDRENLRFERTRVFGRVRQIFKALGRKLHAARALEHSDDVFYLEVEEVLGFVQGVSTCTDLAGLVAVRKSEFELHRSAPPPPDRFETLGPVHFASWDSSLAADEDVTENARRGFACCSGVVRGIARVVRDPRAARLERGEILVAERTDPGWIVLFAAAAGVVTERGSLLSHSAIVAREMGIPAIVSVPGVMGWIEDGDWIEIDGTRGIVTKVTDPVATSKEELHV